MQAAIFIRLALIEARRGGLAWLAPLCIALGVALGFFLAQLAITESRQLQLAVVAALLRFSAVLIVVTQVVSSVRREVDERRLELLLALPVARATQYLGRLAGFVALSVVLAACFALPLLLWAPAAAVLAWAGSLAVELALVAAAALFFAMSLTQLVPSLAATAGLYVLARSISAIQAIGSGPLAEPSLAHEIGRGAVNAVAFLVPTLDRATRTEWLLYGAPDSRTLGVVLAGMLVYTGLLAVAGLFDFQRRAL
jgi:ABC-type Na+ efflux pump permease subunit